MFAVQAQTGTRVKGKFFVKGLTRDGERGILGEILSEKRALMGVGYKSSRFGSTRAEEMETLLL
jgi:hypothetical protein